MPTRQQTTNAKEDEENEEWGHLAYLLIPTRCILITQGIGPIRAKGPVPTKQKGRRKIVSNVNQILVIGRQRRPLDSSSTL
jgi:hypothetical protein